MLNGSPPYDLAILARGINFAGSERHTVDLVNHLVGSGWRVVFVQAGLDLVPWGIRQGDSKLHVVNTRLPMKGLSRSDSRAWYHLLREFPAERALLIKSWYFTADLRCLAAIRKTYPVVYHLEHCLPPERAPCHSRLHFGIVPGV